MPRLSADMYSAGGDRRHEPASALAISLPLPEVRLMQLYAGEKTKANDLARCESCHDVSEARVFRIT
jgi:hypothetical protein